MQYVDAGRVEEIVGQAAAAYRSAEPFPHIVIDGFLKEHVAEALAASFPPVDHRIWKHHLHLNSHKFACNRFAVMPPLFQAVIEELNSKPMLDHFHRLTGIPDLLADAELEGGGLHQIVASGFLKIHADFNYHSTTGRHRRINLLLYLNREWDETWDGNLELWTRDMSRCLKSIAPVLNRAVIFNTTDFAYHGHPRPLRCPPGQSRKSIALYYYTVDRPPEELSRPHSTLYRRRPSDSLARQAVTLAGRLLTSPQALRAALRKRRG